MHNKKEIILELKAHRKRLFQVLKKFKEEEWAEPLGPGKWTVQDMVVHLTHWHRWGLNKLRQMVAYGIIDSSGPKDTDALNELIARAWAQHSLFDIKADLEGIFNEIQAFLSHLPEEWFNKTWEYGDIEADMERWMKFFADHDREHIRELEALKGRQGQ